MFRSAQRFSRVLGAIAAGASALACAGLILHHGFDVAPINGQWARLLQVLAVVAHAFWRIDAWSGRRRGELWVSQGPELLIVLIGAAVGLAHNMRVALLLVALYVITFHGVRGVAATLGRPYASASSATPHPARLMGAAFCLLIAVGGILLVLPKAMTPEARAREGSGPTRVLNAFFTATSAACVTGLTVHEIGNDYTRFGQSVILILIQLGGMGIMLFGSVFGLMLRRQLTLRESLVLQDIYQHDTLGRIARTTWFVCLSTLVIEAVVACGLYSMWSDTIHEPATRWFYAVFHAVSAFCNAGFSLAPDSLRSVAHHWQVYGLIMPAIVLGGLGFPVLGELAHRRWLAIQALRTTSRRPRPPRLSLHSRVILVTSGMLIIVPACCFVLFERNGSHVSEDALGALPWGARAGAALFQSVTCRTAGFHTVSMDPQDIAPASQFLMCILMFIGGSPASTAGGVKTAAVAIMVLGVVATIRRRDRVQIGRREVAMHTVRQASVVIIVMFALVSVMVLILSHTERAPLSSVLFEAVSACSTVGLSVGLTAQLTFEGRIVIMLAMFAGRLGPLTLLVALAGRQRVPSYDYPVEQVSIG
jgi:trk system potassium uptake protein TrkH